MPDAIVLPTTSNSVELGDIDAHVHLWTNDFTRYPLIPSFTPEQLQPPTFEPQDLFDVALPVGVRRAVLIQMVWYGFDNSYMLQCIQQHPGVFAGVALIDEHRDDPAATLRQLIPLDVRGVRIVPPYPGAPDWLKGPGMAALWRAAAEESVAMCHLVDAAALPSIDAMCLQHRDTPVVIDHCARIGGDGVIRDGEVRQLTDLARHPQVHVKLSAFYFLGRKVPPYRDLLPMLRRLIDAYGPERLMWASDCPFQVAPPHDYASAVSLIRDGLDEYSAGDRNAIMRGTAERLFFNP